MDLTLTATTLIVCFETCRNKKQNSLECFKIKIDILTLCSPTSVALHIEYRDQYLFCRAKRMTGFYMKRNTGLKWSNPELTLESPSTTFFLLPLSRFQVFADN